VFLEKYDECNEWNEEPVKFSKKPFTWPTNLVAEAHKNSAPAPALDETTLPIFGIDWEHATDGDAGTYHSPLVVCTENIRSVAQELASENIFVDSLPPADLIVSNPMVVFLDSLDANCPRARVLDRAFALAHSLASLSKPCTVVFALAGAFSIRNGAGKLENDHGNVWGLAKALRAEYPKLTVLCVDVGFSQLNPQQIGSVLIEEMKRKHDGDFDIAIQEGERVTWRLRKTPLQSSLQGKLKHTADKDVYLIAGGMSGIGNLAALTLSKLGARNLVLVSRTGAAKQGASAATVQHLNQLREAPGLFVQFVACDISDREQVRKLFEENIQQQGLVLRGVFHSAGHVPTWSPKDPGPLLRDTTEQDLTFTSAAKVDGALNLHEFTQGTPLDFFVVCSSINTLLSTPRQTSYHVANAALDSIILRRVAMNLPATSVMWGIVAVGAQESLDQAELNKFLEYTNYTNFLSSDTVMGCIAAIVIAPPNTTPPLLVCARIDWVAYEKLLNKQLTLLAPVRQQSTLRRSEPENGHTSLWCVSLRCQVCARSKCRHRARRC